MRYFGLFSSEKATIRGGNLLDTLCGQLEKLLSFQPGEQDLVMLQHKFVVEWKDGKKVSDILRWMSWQEAAALFPVSQPAYLLELFRHDQAELLAHTSRPLYSLSSMCLRD